MKEQLKWKLTQKYGANFKTPLANALGVDVSTVRRWFNSYEKISTLQYHAILHVLEDE